MSAMSNPFHDVTSSLCTVLNFKTSVVWSYWITLWGSSFHIRFYRYMPTLPSNTAWCTTFFQTPWYIRTKRIHMILATKMTLIQDLVWHQCSRILTDQAVYKRHVSFINSMKQFTTGPGKAVLKTHIWYVIHQKRVSKLGKHFIQLWRHLHV